MVACLSFAIPIWMRNGYRFWILGGEHDNRENVRQAPGKKEVCYTYVSTFSNFGTIYIFTLTLLRVMCPMPAVKLARTGWIPEFVSCQRNASCFVAYLNIYNFRPSFVAC